MNMLRATFTSKGQLVIPAQLRKKHNIRAGTQVAIFEDPLGRIVLQPITEEYIDRVTGMLGANSKLPEEWLEEHRIEGEQDKF
jgi:AbrB family looped-hinge helix DNA binding protein